MDMTERTNTDLRAASLVAAAADLMAVPAQREAEALSQALRGCVVHVAGADGPERLRAALALLAAGGRVDVAAALVPDHSLGWRWRTRDLEDGRGSLQVCGRRIRRRAG